MAKDRIPFTAGQYYVECGKLESGKQPRFYLGRPEHVSEDQARVRRQRVRDFWQRSEVQHWTAELMDWVKQIAKGETLIQLPMIAVEPGVQKRINLDAMNQQYAGIVSFHTSAEHIDAYKKAGWNVVGESQQGDPETAGERLYDWLDRFTDHARRTLTERSEDSGQIEPTEWATAFIKNVHGIKRATPDLPLSRLDYPAIESVVIHFASRPDKQKKGKAKDDPTPPEPISVKYAKAHIKAWKRFIKWLPKQTKWRRPDDWEDAFAHLPKVTRQEKSEKPIGRVKWYRPAQLLTIYRYATPYERALFLFAINCGFGAIELSQLKQREIMTEESGETFIKRVRTKNSVGVYGEHYLWPATVEAFKWSSKHTQMNLGLTADEMGPGSLVVVREGGKRLVVKTPKGRSNKAASAWERLTKRIRKDDPEFPNLSFGKLRKTAANLIKPFADGETVGVFHQRSNVVKSDDEADVYSDRLFDRVFKAQREVQRQLAPLWEAVPEPFPEVRAKNYIGLNSMDKIKRLWNEGVKPEEIAKLTGTSKATVYRHRPVQPKPETVDNSSQMGT